MNENLLDIAHREYEQQIAWLAGLIEGEGTFCISRNKTSMFGLSPTFALKMRDEDIIRTAKYILEAMGVGELCIRLKPDLRPNHNSCWEIRTTKAETIENIIFFLYRLFGAKKKGDCDKIIALIDNKKKAKEGSEPR